MCATGGGRGTRGTRSQCEALPGVRGIAERGNVRTQWRGEAANYSQPGIEERDQTHWKRLRFQTPQRRLSIRRAASPVGWKYEQQCGNPNNIVIAADNSELKNISKQEYQWRCCFKITCTLRPATPPQYSLALWLHSYDVWIVPRSISSTNTNGTTHGLNVPRAADKRLNIRQAQQT